MDKGRRNFINCQNSELIKIQRLASLRSNLFPSSLRDAELSTDNFFYDKETKTFSQEVSSLEIKGAADTITLKNPKTNKTRIFKHVEIMRIDSGEDIGGWKYKSNELILLIWND